jgi:pimeloyl-ACP methyl ester carboxylesterase
LVADGVALDAFHPLANARDVDVVRGALDEERVDLLAVSYGTKIALLAAAEHPQGIGALVLDAPIDPTMTFAEEAVEVDRAIRRLDEHCAGDTTCLANVGDLETALDATIARLTDEPEQATAMIGHQQLTVTVGPEEFTDALVLLSGDPESLTLLPALVRRARDGDLDPLLRRTLHPGAWGISHGMAMSMACAGFPEDPEAQLATVRDDPRQLVIPSGSVPASGRSVTCGTSRCATTRLTSSWTSSIQPSS